MSINVQIIKNVSPEFTLDVSFQSEGHTGILGPSGCGKSMTLQCISGVETPQKGFVMVNDKILFDHAGKINVPPQKRKTGHLFQQYALFPNMTVEQNIAFCLTGKKRGQSNCVTAILDNFRLNSVKNQYPHQLSGGQKQRCALARMLVTEPDIILLDEPFSALDSHLREAMHLQLKHYLQNKDDVILVTHSRDEVYKLCKNLIIMNKGKVLIQGATKDLFRQPVYKKAAELTGCKNISPAKKTGPFQIWAEHWAMALTTTFPVPDDIRYVGIRAHHIKPATGLEKYNTFPIHIVETSQELFETFILFNHSAAKIASKPFSQPLWWKLDQQQSFSAEQYIYIPPENILLLK